MLLLNSVFLFAQEEAEKNEKIEYIWIDMDISEEVLKDNLTQKFIKQYTSDFGKKYLNKVMTDALSYRGYIQYELADHQMPLCLQYLPVIESAYKTTALSKSGARGLWQFMQNSIAPFGIRVDKWMDERMDPWLSTDAAIKKLEENYKILGSWELALAAYNCGLGAVRKAVKNSGSNDYWYLCKKGYFRNETVNYLPKFIAVSYILENKKNFGLDYPEAAPGADDSTRFETISVKKNIDLKILSEKSGIPLEKLNYYNPALYYGITPPDKSYSLRIPEGKREEICKIIENESLIKYHMYTVKSGDSLYALSLHYGVEVEDIQRANKLKNTNIKIGQVLMIPSLKDVSEYKNPKLEDKPDFSGTYIVQQKDTLWSLAVKFNVQLELLASENNMEIDDILRVGSSIKVPISKEEKTKKGKGFIFNE